MHQPASTEHAPTFAGMLAALAAPGQKRPPARDLGGFEEDVATLSYERALRAHTRYRASDATDRALTQIPDAEALHFDEFPLGAGISAPQSGVAQPGIVPEVDAELEADSGSPTGNEARSESDTNLKCASITIRVSKAECAQLRQRAAEAGLTVSAYLRSCTLEAEALRTQVKETLAQLRSETILEMKPKEIEAGAASPKGSWLGRLRFWPHQEEKLSAAGG